MPVAVSSRLPGERGLAPRLAALRWLAGMAIGLPIAIIAALGVNAWYAAWREAERELTRSSDAVGEYVLRVLDGHRVAVDRVNDLLEHLSNEQIQAQEGALHQRLARLLPDLPLVETITVLGADGLMLLTANIHPVPRESYFADREWVRDLKSPQAPRTHISKVNIGRLDANLFFGVSRRRMMVERSGTSEAYDGVIHISMGPNKVAAGFADLVKDPGDKVAIIRTDGEILARWPGFAIPLPPLQPATHPSFFQFVSTGAERGVHISSSSGESDGLVAFRRLQNFPVVATVTRERGAIARRWWQNFRQPLGIGIPLVALVAVMAVFAWRRAEELDQAQAAARFHAVFDATPVGLAVVDVDSTRVLAANDHLMSLAGNMHHPVTEGFDLRHVLTAESAARFNEVMAKVRGGGACGPVDLDLVSAGHRRIPVRFSCSALPGNPPRIVLVVQDISELRETEARRELMMREVEHRSKNTLALFQAALRLGASGTSDARELAKAVEARITALDRSQSLLATVGEQGAALRELIEEEVAPFATRGLDLGEDSLILSGGDVRITARAAQALAMTLHELATNAAKYGAFSSKMGSVRIAWRIDAERGVLVCEWTERNGPFIEDDERTVGFGTRLIDTSLREVGGTIERRWQASGLEVEIALPLQQVLASAA